MTGDPSDLRVYCMTPLWGMPTIGPYSLKLLTWLRLGDVPHRIVFEDDPRKGPKKKSPWIDDGGTLMGDSELIIEHLTQTRGIDPDAHLTAAERALGLTLRRTFEEHFDQVFEQMWFVDDAGWAQLLPHFDFLPAPVRPLVRALIRSEIRKNGHVRGVGRHDRDEIVRMGRADLDAAAALLGDQAFFFGDRPTLTDCSLYGFLALTLWSDVASPMREHLHRCDNLAAFCDRMRARFWSETHARAA